MSFRWLIVVKNLPENAGDRRNVDSVPGLGRSPGGGHGNPFQYSYLENPKDRGAWRALGLDTTEATQHAQVIAYWLSRSWLD